MRGPQSERICPHCERPCEVVEHRDLVLDHCRGCRGTFLEAGEASAIFGPYVSPETWRRAKDTTFLRSGAVQCPADGAPMDTYRIGLADPGSGRAAESVEIDLCPECVGMWVEPQEGKRLREIVMAAGQRKGTLLSDFASNPGMGTYLFQLVSGLPIEVWNPYRRFPVLTTGLIGLFIAVFALMSNADNAQRMFGLFELIPAQVRQGERLWTLVTSSFLHVGVIHVIVNAYFLYVFGANVEDALGVGRFLLIYLASALAGSLLQTLLQADPTIPVVGASDAVAGLMGAYLILFPKVRVFQVLFFIRFRLRIAWYLALWVGVNLVLAATGDSLVAVWAHLGGFAAGVGLGWLYRIRPLAYELRPA